MKMSTTRWRNSITNSGGTKERGREEWVNHCHTCTIVPEIKKEDDRIVGGIAAKKW